MDGSMIVISEETDNRADKDFLAAPFNYINYNYPY